MRTVRLIWPWIRPYRRYLFGGLTASLVSVVMSLSVPLLTSRIIDEGITANDTGLVVRTAFFMVVLILAGMSSSAFASLLGVRLAFNTITDLRRDLYGHIQTLSFGNFDRISSGEILTRLTSDMTKVTTLLSVGVSFAAQIPFMFVGALIAIVLVDISLVPIVLVMLPVIGLLIWYVVVRSNVLYDALQSRLDRLNTVLQENIQGAEVIKAFVRQEHEIERFDRAATDLAVEATTVNQLVASLFPTLITISAMGISAVLWIGGGNVIDGELSTGDLVAFIQFMTLVAMPMMFFAFLQPVISAASASLARIGEVLDDVSDVSFPDSETAHASGLGGLDIEFDDVSFAYDGDDMAGAECALRNVSFRIAAGTTVAVLGATGSGKSTLVHLIPRFYDATAGVVRVGGVDVRSLPKSTLRRSIGIALQQPYLFSGTVLESLRFARPDATDAEVIAAATAAQAHEFIESMPDGYDSHVEQGGSNLSGGQRQRLAIARTLLSDPQILIFDDSTSAVDLETEARIQEVFEELTGVTVILVAQRISTALVADEIIVLDHGHLSAIGTHDELIETSELYREIYRSQLGEPVA